MTMTPPVAGAQPRAQQPASERGRLFVVGYAELEVAPGASPWSADNVVMLDLVREGPELKRTITITKTRGGGHDPNVRELSISPDGIHIGDPVGMLAS